MNQPRRILVLQLARLGDIVQTLPTLQGLKASYPGCELTLVVRSTFADAARLSPHVDKLVEFPSQDILGPALGGAGDKAAALAALTSWLAPLASQPFDLLLNLTFSDASSYLAAIIPAAEKRGVSRTREGTLTIADPWSQYFFAQILEKNLNILHLNEVFSKIAGVEEVLSWPPELAQSQEIRVSPAPKGGRLGLQLSASQPEKTLPDAVWSVIVQRILEADAEVELVFFGSKADARVIEKVRGTLPVGLLNRTRSLAGALRFHENLLWVQSCKAVISPDTAMVHLASAAGIRVIEVALGGVRPLETGPYGAGHSVLAPLPGADGVVSTEALARAVLAAVGGDPVEPAAARHWETQLIQRPNGCQRHSLVARNFEPDETTSFFETSYYLLAEFRCAGVIEELGIPKLGSPSQAESVDRLVHAFDGLCALRRLAEFGQHYCVEMLQRCNDPVGLAQLTEKLAQIEGHLVTLKKTVPLMKPLIDTWTVAKDLAALPSNEAGVETVIAMTEGAYRELKQNSDIVEELLQTAVRTAQQGLGAGETAKRVPEGISSSTKERST